MARKRIETGVGKLTFIFALGLLFLLPLALAVDSAQLAPSSKPCKLTAECDQGYCENGVCTLPSVVGKYDVTGSCTTTADCQQGFCENGQCILLQRQEFAIVDLGAKSGCAGIIENCTGIWCYFCNATWIFLVVGAAVAAWAGRKRGRIVPILMAIIPLGFGYLVLPILGFILAVVEIFVLLLVKKERLVDNHNKTGLK